MTTTMMMVMAIIIIIIGEVKIKEESLSGSFASSCSFLAFDPIFKF